MGGHVYILTNHSRTVLYTGVTANLPARLEEHRQGRSEFTSRYGAIRLVWHEAHDDILTAIQREKQIKRWRREWKEELIRSVNPDWRDLHKDLLR